MSRGYHIQNHILDYECSAELKAAFSKYNIQTVKFTVILLSDT